MPNGAGTKRQLGEGTAVAKAAAPVAVAGSESRQTRVAIWANPRSLSTALLRSWGSRADVSATDEPLYAAFLHATGRTDHPISKKIVEALETDAATIINELTEQRIPNDKTIWVQKHMCHHLLPAMGTAWIRKLKNFFLIRDPSQLLTSLMKQLSGDPTIEDTGLPQMLELFNMLRDQTGAIPLVVDSRDIQEDPEGMLRLMCAEMGVAFTPEMLSWSPGPKSWDHMQAPYWYGSVAKTTCFAPFKLKEERVPPRLEGLLAECKAIYGQLYKFRRTAADGGGAKRARMEQPAEAGSSAIAAVASMDGSRPKQS